MDEKLISKIGRDIIGLIDSSCETGDHGWYCEEIDDISCECFSYHTIVVSSDIGEGRITCCCLCLRDERKFVIARHEAI